MNDDTGTKGTPWLELAIGAFGALMVTSMVGYLVQKAVGAGETAPPDIVLERDGAFTEQSAGWRVPVLVRNLGDRPAEAVALSAELELADGEVEHVALTLDFLPPRGSVEAAFLFVRDPGDGELSLRALGYLGP